ncbi:MAG: HPP family protein [Candidatus Tantalella remota]|nr:HPP family protein [Candidatus Tantalella remota]
MRIFDQKFREHKLKYIVQSVAGGLAICVSLLFFDMLRQPVIISSLGASAFIVFCTPHRGTATGRHLIGGYILGIIAGLLVHLMARVSFDMYISEMLYNILIGGVSVGLAVFMMAITNTEHAPATGIALAIGLNGATGLQLVHIIAAIVVISAIHRVTKAWMVDLI